MEPIAKHLPIYILVAVITLAAILTPPPTIRAAPVGVTPGAGQPGTRFTFVAANFEPNETVDVWLNTPAGRPIDADVTQLNRANRNGRADWYWTAPLDTQPGPWQMVARGRSSGVEHVIPFTIDAVSPTERNANVAPREGAGGTRFFFYATGFRPDESIDVEISGPPEAEQSGEFGGNLSANPAGRADWYWQSPIDVAPGTWLVSARGNDSGVIHRIEFRIRSTLP